MAFCELPQRRRDWSGTFLSEGGKTLVVALVIFAVTALAWVML